MYIQIKWRYQLSGQKWESSLNDQNIQQEDYVLPISRRKPVQEKNPWVPQRGSGSC